MTKPKEPAASDIVALAYSMPKHPRHDDLIEAAIRLLAAAVQNTASPDQPVSEVEALEGALAEFTTGLDALVFMPDDGRFVAVWRSAQWAQMLKPYIKAAWQLSPGTYGKHEPVNYDPKHNPSNLH
jgi:hypothetical protein